MAHDKFRDAVAAMSDERRTEFDRITKSKGKPPAEVVSFIQSYPGNIQKFYDAAGVPTPEQEELNAALSMAGSSERSADAAERSATAAEDSARFARHSRAWAAVSAIAAVIAILIAIIKGCAGQVTQPEKNEKAQQDESTVPSKAAPSASSDVR